MSNSLSICSTVSPIVVMILVDVLDSKLFKFNQRSQGRALIPP